MCFALAQCLALVRAFGYVMAMNATVGTMIWRIVGYDGMQTIFEANIPETELDVQGVIRLLQLLIAGALEAGEIVEAATGKSSYLDVKVQTGVGNRIMFYGGENPNFTAILCPSGEPA
jgi:hypothetical protein